MLWQALPEGVHDIDGEEVQNPMMVPEYAKEIFGNMFAMEVRDKLN